MEINTTYDTPLLTALEGLAPHDHQSLIYESPEDHFAVAIPFIRIGLERGDKCVYIADDGTEAVVRKAMHDHGIDVERAIASDSLVLATKESAFLKHGSFDPEWMPTFWREATAQALQQGFSALRATGETEWVLSGAEGIGRWMEYESRLTQVLADLNCFALCQLQSPAAFTRDHP
jgi:chemotaxis family two-component system sensor kinase Cph1